MKFPGPTRQFSYLLSIVYDCLVTEGQDDRTFVERRGIACSASQFEKAVAQLMWSE